MTEMQIKYSNHYFSFKQRILLKLLRNCCSDASNFIWGLKFFGFEDDACCRALERYYNFKYEEAKMIVSELVGNPYVNNNKKSKILNSKNNIQ